MKKLLVLLTFVFSLNINAQVTDSTRVDNFQQTDQVLAEIVQKGIKLAEKTGEFAIEQAPLLLQEFYKWNITKCILFIVIGLLLFIGSIYISNLYGSKTKFTYIEFEGYSYQKEKEATLIKGRYYKSYDNFISHNIIRFIGILIFLILLFVQIYKLLFIILAPKLFLINYFIQ